MTKNVIQHITSKLLTITRWRERQKSDIGSHQGSEGFKPFKPPLSPFSFYKHMLIFNAFQIDAHKRHTHTHSSKRSGSDDNLDFNQIHFFRSEKLIYLKFEKTILLWLKWMNCSFVWRVKEDSEKKINYKLMWVKIIMWCHL